MSQYNEIHGSPIKETTNNTFKLKFNSIATKTFQFKSNINIAAIRTKMYRCEFFMDPHNTFKLRFSTLSRTTKLFKSDITIHPIRTKLYKCEFFMQPHNTFKLRFTSVNTNSILFKSTLIYFKQSISMYKSTFSIPPQNIMMVKYRSGVISKNLYTSTITNRIDRLNMYLSIITIPPKNKMYGKVKILGFNRLEYKGEFTSIVERIRRYKTTFEVPIFDKIFTYKGTITTVLEFLLMYKCMISLSPKNSMFGAIELNKTPAKKYYGDLIKDTFITPSRPDENFGDNKQLYASKDSTMYLQWSFNKNKDTLYDPNNETGAFLRLNLKRVLPKDSTITVYISPNTEWVEMDVTNNTPLETNIIKTFDMRRNKSGEFIFELGNILKEYDKSNGFDITLAITSPSEAPIISNSKETLDNSPSLYYEYYYIPPVLRNRLYKCLYIGRKDGFNLYKSDIKVISENGGLLYKSDITVKGFEGNLQYKCTFTNAIPKFNYPRFKSTLSIPKFDKEIIYKNNFINKIERIPIYKTNIDIPKFNNINYFKFDVINRLDTYVEYMCKFTIPRSEDISKDYKTEFIIPKFTKSLEYKSIVDTIAIRRFLYKCELMNIPTGNYQYKSILDIPKFNAQADFKTRFIVPVRYFKFFKFEFTIPKIKGNPEFKSEVIIRKDNEIFYKTKFNIAKYDIDMIYKSTLYHLPAYIEMYQCEIKVISNNKRVRIFIM